MAERAEPRAARRAAFAATIALHERMRGELGPTLRRGAGDVARRSRRGRKLLVFGNGGSAADAQHLAAELVGRFQKRARGVAAIALTTDTSILTSDRERLLVQAGVRAADRGARAAGRRGVGISTSGESPNVLAALRDGARRAGWRRSP